MMFSNCSTTRVGSSSGGDAIQWRRHRASGSLGFILSTGIDGTRYAVRQQAVAVIRDADECHDETIVQLDGGHLVRVLCALEGVLAWFA